MTSPTLEEGVSSASEVVCVPAVEIQQGNTRCISTKLTLGQLRQFAQTEFYQSGYSQTDEKQGYQRPLSEGRAKSIERYMVSEQQGRGFVRMPSPILCSAREQDLEYADGQLILRLSHRLYIIDGQHRAEAYRLAFENNSIDGWSDFEVPLIIVTGVSKIEEMRLFNTINSTQKPVDPSLTAQILAMVDSNGGKLSPQEEDKAVYANVIKMLNESAGSPFRGLIAMPDHNKMLTGRVTKAKSVQDSIKSLESVMYDRSMDSLTITARSSNLVKLVSTIWNALKAIPSLNEVFEEPEHFALQQAGGVTIVHLVALHICRNYLNHQTRLNISTWKDLFTRSISISDPVYWSKGTKMIDGQPMQRGAAPLATGRSQFVMLAKALVNEINAQEYFAGPPPMPVEEPEVVKEAPGFSKPEPQARPPAKLIKKPPLKKTVSKPITKPGLKSKPTSKVPASRAPSKKKTNKR